MIQAGKAFLSHTSSDKSFVEAVATRLGRVACVFDKACFHLGDNFTEVIEQKLAESDLFVLFASRKSLRAEWVSFELEEAALLRVGKRLKKILVVALEPDIPIDAYPMWLRSSNIKFVPNADLAAREIRTHLDFLLAGRMPVTFVGRAREMQACENALAPLVFTTEPPRILVVTGLEGIGRRTLLARVATNLLQLQRSLSIPISSVDSISDIVFRLQCGLEPPSTPDRLKKLRFAFEAMPHPEALENLARILRTIVESGELPVFVDEGGIIDSNGEYAAIAEELLNCVSKEPKVYAAVVTHRKTPETSTANVSTPSVAVRPLDASDVQRLLSFLLRNSQVAVSSEQLSSLAARTKGHPPSAYYAAKLVERYGSDLAEKSASKLEDFQASTFIRYLMDNNGLTATHGRVLKLLAAYSPLPLDVLQNALNVQPDEAWKLIAETIDLSLVIPHETGFYSLAGPVETAVRRVFSREAVDHAKLATLLQGYLDSADDRDRYLILAQHASRAAALSGTKEPLWAIALPRDLLDLAKTFYHEQDYESAVKYATQVLAMRPQNADAHLYLVRGLIQLEDFPAARKELMYFQRPGSLREYHFLSGFLERKMQNPEAAIVRYTLARQVGLDGVAVHRELAQCCFLTGKMDEARGHIERARASDRDNKYLIDLELQIALARGDITTAEKLIEKLEIVDRESFVFFRRSIIAQMRHLENDALDYARKAMASLVGRPTFEMHVQLAKCLINAGKLDEASDVQRDIDRKFSGRRTDVRTGLWCKWEIAQKRWEDADRRWLSLSNRDLPVHLALRRSILEGLLQSSGLSVSRRDELERELVDVSRRLLAFDPEALLQSGMVMGGLP